MMSLRTARTLGFAILPFGLIAAYFLGAGIAQPLPLFNQLATAVFAICCVTAFAWVHPHVATAVAVAVPLIAQTGTSSLVLYGGLLLVALAIARMWPTSSRRGRRSAVVITLFGGMTVAFGLLLAEANPSRAQLGIAAGYATAIGVAAALSNMPAPFMFAIVSTIGVWTSLVAARTPALRFDRTVAVLGENANGIGMFAALGFAAALMGWVSVPGKRRWFFLIAIVVCPWGLYVSGSRGAAVISLVAVAVLVMGRWLRGSSIRSLLTSAAASTVVVALAVHLVGWFADVTGRTASGVDPGFTVREDAISYAIQEGLGHPLFGVGFAQLGAVSQSDSSSRIGLRAHNLYIGIFAELGVPALILIVLLSIIAVRHAREHSTAALAMVCSVIAAGISLEWWGAGSTGPLAMLVLGWGAGLATADAAGMDSRYGGGSISIEKAS